MKTKKIQFLLFYFLLIFQSQLSASCFGEGMSVTEFLNHPDDSRSIIRVRVDSSFRNPNHTYGAFATVLEVFKGENIQKAIKINSGGTTTAGGKRLKKEQEYIVSSKSKDGYEFNAFVCDPFSFPIKNGMTYKTGRYEPSYGDKIYELFKQFFQFKKNRYTGEVVLKNEEGIWAKGRFESGVAHGVWRNFAHGSFGDSLILRSLTAYDHGIFEGMSIYYQTVGHSLLDKIVFYSKSELIWEEVYSTGDYPNIYKRKLTEYFSSKNGKVRRGFYYFTNGNKQISETRLLPVELAEVKEVAVYSMPHGVYESFYENGFLKVTGEFFRGAKIGIWTRYDSLRRNPPIIDTFPFPDTSLAEFTCFFEDGTPYIWGNLKDNKPEGIWNKFWDKRRKQVFNFKNGKLYGTAFYYNEKGILSEKKNYKKGILQGKNIIYHDDGKTIASVVNFKNGKKEGKEKSFYSDGSLRSFGFYENGLKEGVFTLFKNGKEYKTHYFKNYLHGYSERFLAGSPDNLETGEYHFNQKVGVWKYYSPSGKLTLEEFYPTVREIYPFNWYSARRIKLYDKNGKIKDDKIFEDWMIGNLRKN